MAKYETVSVKAPVELEEKAAGLGVETAEVPRRALEEEVERREIEEINAELERLKPVLDNIGTVGVVAMIREDRERRGRGSSTPQAYSRWRRAATSRCSPTDIL